MHPFQTFLQRIRFAINGCQLVCQKSKMQMGIGEAREHALTLQVDDLAGTPQGRTYIPDGKNRADDSILNDQGFQFGARGYPCKNTRWSDITCHSFNPRLFRDMVTSHQKRIDGDASALFPGLQIHFGIEKLAQFIFERLKLRALGLGGLFPGGFPK